MYLHAAWPVVRRRSSSQLLGIRVPSPPVHVKSGSGGIGFYFSVSQLHRFSSCEGRSALLISALHSPIKAVHPGTFSTYFHALSYFWDRVLAILDRRFHKFARVSSRRSPSTSPSRVVLRSRGRSASRSTAPRRSSLFIRSTPANRRSDASRIRLQTMRRAPGAADAARRRSEQILR